MSQPAIAKDSVQVVLDLLRGGLEPGVFKEFYDGDPDLIPDFNLPCVIVEQATDLTTGAAYATDDITDTVVIRVVFNKKDDWTAQLDPTNTTQSKLRRVIDTRDAPTGEYLPNTIKGILRPQLYGARRIDGDMNVEYRPNIRPDQAGASYATNEATVTVTLTSTVDVPPIEQ